MKKLKAVFVIVAILLVAGLFYYFQGTGSRTSTEWPEESLFGLTEEPEIESGIFKSTYYNPEIKSPQNIVP